MGLELLEHILLDVAGGLHDERHLLIPGSNLPLEEVISQLILDPLLPDLMESNLHQPEQIFYW
jgi:hypothetical protein